LDAFAGPKVARPVEKAPVVPRGSTPRCVAGMTRDQVSETTRDQVSETLSAPGAWACARGAWACASRPCRRTPPPSHHGQAISLVSPPSRDMTRPLPRQGMQSAWPPETSGPAAARGSITGAEEAAGRSPGGLAPAAGGSGGLSSGVGTQRRTLAVRRAGGRGLYRSAGARDWQEAGRGATVTRAT
jgi:hypothetical protein